jgi:AcrR family transcriptional regulator
MAEHRTGPVRSEQARVDILSAAAHLFASRGYEHLTMEGIAAEAGVGKQTIYRWWGSKGGVVAECLIEGMLLPIRPAPSDSGDLRADLSIWLTEILEGIELLGGNAFLRSLIVAAAESDEVGARLRVSLGADASVVSRLRAAVRSGELRADAPLEEIGQALIGAVLVRAVMRLPSLQVGAADRIVDAVLGELR